jgi:hypothetical protein
MLSSAVSRARMTVVLGAVIVVAAAPLSRLARAADPAVAVPATGPAQPLQDEWLAPCLIAAADGSPVAPSPSYPAGKRMSVAFRVKPDEQARTLKAKWYALGPRGEQFLADSSKDLRASKDGGIVLEAPGNRVPPGKYRVDVTLDDRPWKSTELQITPPLAAAAEKPAELVPLIEGTTMAYDLLVRSGPGTKSQIPGGTSDPDGAVRGSISFAIGPTTDDGTLFTGSIGGQTLEMRVRLDNDGLKATRRGPAGGDLAPVDPPEMLHPLPPSLADGTEWTATTRAGGKQGLRVFGPLPLAGPDGPAPGYVIFGEEQTAAGEPGTPAVRGKETVERHYIPNVGLVREVRVSVLGGKFSSRQELTLRKPDRPGAAADDGAAAP